MSLDLKQNYFSLFDVAVDFEVPLQQISEKHLKLQSLLHPDRYATASATEKRVAAQKAAFVNEAFRVLSNPCARANYLLDLANTSVDEQTETIQDAAVVLEQIELREQLEESTSLTELQVLQQHAQTKFDACSQAFATSYRQADFSGAQQQLAQMQLFHKLLTETKQKTRNSE